MEYLKQLVFGIRREPQETFIDGFTTTMPKEHLDFNTWCIQLKVSSQYTPKYYNQFNNQFNNN